MSTAEGRVRKTHFISGLPRSGTTLLSALLRQNPNFHASMSGPLSTMFDALLGAMSGRNEFSIFLNDVQRQRVLRGLFDNYYEGMDRGVVFDTSRSWCTRLKALKILLPEARVIVCVRELSWVVDSVERVVRANAFEPSGIFNYQTGGTVYTRANGLAGSDGMVGYAYDAVKEAFYGEDSDRMIVVQYESLVENPKRVLNAIYDFIGEPHFSHDFENVQIDLDEFDKRMGTPGLHEVHRKVEARTRKTILPPDLFHRFEKDSFWRNPQQNLNKVKVI